MESWKVWVFWAIAIIASLLYGWFAVEIHSPPKTAANPCPIPTTYPKSWWWHQRWLNFLGSIVGWVALWYLFNKFHNSLSSTNCTVFDAWDIAASLIAFAGITGFLPGTLVSTFSAFGGLSAKLAEMLASWVTKLK